MIGPSLSLWLDAVWGFLGIPGFREVVLVALVALALYGRSGLRQPQYVRMLRPWLSPFRRPSPTRPAPPPGRWKAKLGDRVYWFLAIVAATAVAAWIVTRTLIVAAPGASR